METLDKRYPLIEPYIGKSSGLWIDFFVILGAALLVGVLCMVWVKFIRNRSRSGSSSALKQSNGGDSSSGRRRGGRKHRVSYTKRYPTLSETGGLPPLRGEPDPVAPPPRRSDSANPEITS